MSIHVTLNSHASRSSGAPQHDDYIQSGLFARGSGNLPDGTKGGPTRCLYVVTRLYPVYKKALNPRHPLSSVFIIHRDLIFILTLTFICLSPLLYYDCCHDEVFGCSHFRKSSLLKDPSSRPRGILYTWYLQNLCKCFFPLSNPTLNPTLELRDPSTCVKSPEPGARSAERT